MREDEEKEALSPSLSAFAYRTNRGWDRPTTEDASISPTAKASKCEKGDRQTDREDQTSSFSLRVPNLPPQVVFPLSTFYVILVDDVG